MFFGLGPRPPHDAIDREKGLARATKDVVKPGDYRGLAWHKMQAGVYVAALADYSPKAERDSGISASDVTRDLSMERMKRNDEILTAEVAAPCSR